MPAGDLTTTPPEKEPKKIEDIFDLEKKGEPIAPERPKQPPEMQREAVPEVRPERPAEAGAEEEAARRRYAPPPSAQEPVVPPVVKSEEFVRIENILSENLDELYLQMTPQQQMAFKQKGEETSNKVQALLREAKVKAKEILNLIKDWLRLLPGINKFFLEQEAKIKTDRLLNLREQKHKQK
jgi:hypothetical protein